MSRTIRLTMRLEMALGARMSEERASSLIFDRRYGSSPLLRRFWSVADKHMSSPQRACLGRNCYVLVPLPAVFTVATW